eukprot:9583846-Lingulodinium_polyedra.AAC.1
MVLCRVIAESRATRGSNVCASFGICQTIRQCVCNGRALVRRWPADGRPMAGRRSADGRPMRSGKN